ncbi:NUDIX hydrolase N-terminal domain-containing protein [Companilactobacillus allii]|uniref:ADP-ribose pyrophosphatase n=1 Tax=Companilactobacillus allii TaxID=1847728 RepID=A0A1P8Q5Q1_9LACO|nr:NUDIX hydrolase N-terminal domain-containing protein [Companilactobacillus allii]APX73179.1 ADP-ribose pyrophosphatase [Companilactobacillus allii]USQ67987.1 NUDIX hydrolase N-terminal domain-containing protein [Companilactobacillus allii]
MDDLELLIQQLQAIAQSGKHYSKDVFDSERYEQLEEVAKKLTAKLTGATHEQLNIFFDSDNGYVTPKVDVRAVTFNDDGKILLVNEKRGNTWSIPGGWADIGYSIGEIATKETQEEAGIKVSPKRLIAVIDMQKHNYSKKNLSYIYKNFVECVPENDKLLSKVDNSETDDAQYFTLKEALELNLSLNRNLPEDLEVAFKCHDSKDWETIFD